MLPRRLGLGRLLRWRLVRRGALYWFRRLRLRGFSWLRLPGILGRLLRICSWLLRGSRLCGPCIRCAGLHHGSLFQAGLRSTSLYAGSCTCGPRKRGAGDAGVRSRSSGNLQGARLCCPCTCCRAGGCSAGLCYRPTCGALEPAAKPIGSPDLLLDGSAEHSVLLRGQPLGWESLQRLLSRAAASPRRRLLIACGSGITFRVSRDMFSPT